MDKLKIEYMKIDELTPYENNAREHQEDDIEAIKQSIQDFGMCDPIGIWGDDNIIVEGHGRLLALQALGQKTAPCIRLDHLDDEHRRGYALAHNRTAELSRWNDEALSIELGEIPSIDMDCYKFDLELGEQETSLDLDDEESDCSDDDVKMYHCPKCGFAFEVKE
jgi:ParB-like chromosome segregation protein Spo0J